MNYKNLLFLLMMLGTVNVFANPVIDSIGIENLNGKKIILHKIEAKETYYSLGRTYNLSPSKIMDFNGNVSLHPGEVVKIPTNQIFSNKPVSFSSPKKDEKITKKETTHKVAPGETLYAVASKYNMRVDDLKLMNALKSNNLSIGQVLKVISSEEVSLTPTVEKNAAGNTVLVDKKPVSKPVSSNTPVNKIKYLDSTDSQASIEIPKNRYGITEMNDKGLAVWIEDNNMDATKSYALHRTAPVGTIIKITNPMSNRSVFAKVVGRYTENETTKDVIIVLTKSCADAVGALDKRFLVNITFGIPNEQ
ncbi:LysM peptidoglycan-binding domain-containing protein [Pedobacter alpinus]|uniref:LysM peptidoglycan-binding domain-containing protein n=1 Tax=Pedobacter alpinus TaxID=1590643 RepID=A0ABW5TVQ9_9SPHI